MRATGINLTKSDVEEVPLSTDYDLGEATSTGSDATGPMARTVLMHGDAIVVSALIKAWHGDADSPTPSSLFPPAHTGGAPARSREVLSPHPSYSPLK